MGGSPATRLQAAYPLGELCVHHEVVDVLLSFGELQLPCHDSHYQGGAASPLAGKRENQKQNTTLKVSQKSNPNINSASCLHCCRSLFEIPVAAVLNFPKDRNPNGYYH